MWQATLPIKNFFLLLLLLYVVVANDIASADNSVSEALSSSPNDVIQLLSTLEKGSIGST